MDSKAKSRLGGKSVQAKNVTKHDYPSDDISIEPSQLSTAREINRLTNWKRNVLAFLPWLGGSFFCYLLLYFLIVNIPPQQIKNMPWPDMYLPAQFLLAAGNFMLATFFWQNKWRGLLSMLLINGLVFLWLQKVELTPLVVMIWTLPWIGIIVFDLIKAKKTLSPESVTKF